MTIRVSVWACAVACAILSNAMAADQPTSAPASQPSSTDPSSSKGYAGQDWPQWRGPNRDGIAVNSPKLLDAWPKEGPRLLWKSDPTPPWAEGGCGSISVADGKAFFYVNWAHFKPGKIITADYVAAWGWAPDMPEELVKKVEAARLSADRATATTPAAVDAFAKGFVAKLDGADAKKFGAAIENRLRKGPNAWTWETMANLAKNVDKVINTREDVWALFKATDIHHNELLTNEITRFTKSAQEFTDTIICLDAVTGKQLWKKEFPATYAAMWGSNFMACGTPAVAGGKCCVAGSVGLYCLSAKDGELAWRVPTRYSNSSPLILGDAVYVLASPSEKPVNTMGGELCGYDLATGRLLWRQPKVASGWGSSVVPWATGGTNYLIANSDGGTFCVDPAKGEILWRVPGGGSSTAAISGDTMVVHGSKIRAFAITSAKADLLWEKPVHGDRMGSPLIFGGNVYFEGAYQDGFGCLDLKTGEQKWIEMREVGHCSSPVLADGKLFALFGASSGQAESTQSIRMCKATVEKLQELGRFNPSVAVCASPTVAGGRLYLRLNDCVACYDLRAEGH